MRSACSSSISVIDPLVMPCCSRKRSSDIAMTSTIAFPMPTTSNGAVLTARVLRAAAAVFPSTLTPDPLGGLDDPLELAPLHVLGQRLTLPESTEAALRA